MLILEGTSVAGTKSIYDLLSNEKELGQILDKFKNPDGSLKQFEVLLASQSSMEARLSFRWLRPERTTDQETADRFRSKKDAKDALPSSLLPLS